MPVGGASVEMAVIAARHDCLHISAGIGRQKDALPNCKRGWERPGDRGIHLGRYCRVARQTRARRRGGPRGLALTYLVQVGRKGEQGPLVVREANVD